MNVNKMFFLYHFSIDANGMLTENMVNKAHGKLFYFPQITFFWLSFVTSEAGHQSIIFLTFNDYNPSVDLEVQYVHQLNHWDKVLSNS